MSGEEQLVKEESNVPERVGQLGGESTYATPMGVRTLRRVPTCNRCHRLLGEDYMYCVCSRAICNSCAVFYQPQNVWYCVDCVRRRLPLTKLEFLTLTAFARSISSTKDISRIALVKRKETKAVIRDLASRGFIVRRSIPLFSPYELTHRGEVAQGIYQQIYGKHYDVTNFSIRLSAKEAEKNGIR